jgi:hypothetical protein
MTQARGSEVPPLCCFHFINNRNVSLLRPTSGGVKETLGFASCAAEIEVDARNGLLEIKIQVNVN